MPFSLSNGGMAALTVEQMSESERLAAKQGISSLKLMENAAQAVVTQIVQRWSPRPTLILCGPGNNGGDGLGIAILLRNLRWPVKVALLKSRQRYSGDAHTMFLRWNGPQIAFDENHLDGATLVIDALFGAGLNRSISGAARLMLERATSRHLDIVAVDIPSGVDGNTGQVRGYSAPSRITVTFFRPKIGHLLLPGKELLGELVVSDIGIPSGILRDLVPKQYINGPALWFNEWVQLDAATHKYRRGHGVVVGGPKGSTGAARLAAESALRVGAGLLTVAAPENALDIYASHLTAVMTQTTVSSTDVSRLLLDERKNAVLIGPGGGLNERTKEIVLNTLDTGKACVLDADALTCFSEESEKLFNNISENCVITPHDGEYKRLFEFEGDRLVRARAAAQASGAIVVLKGGDTVVAAPDGDAAILCNATADLATAGSGDVLSGLILGLLAQSYSPYASACIATWIHGELSRQIGAGLISEDLPVVVPEVLQRLSQLVRLWS